MWGRRGRRAKKKIKKKKKKKNFFSHNDVQFLSTKREKNDNLRHKQVNKNDVV